MRAASAAAGCAALIGAVLFVIAPAAAQALVVPVVGTPNTQPRLVGPFTPEGPRLREQLWLLPTGEGGAPRLRATLFRPPGAGPFPLAVINHNSAGAAADRLGFSLPTFFFLSRWLVERGYAVVLPLRRGYGGSEGAFAESIGACNDPAYVEAADGTAADIEATIDHLATQPFVRPGPALVVGVGGGGWGALALSARAPHKVAAVIGFGAGRGSVGPTAPGEVCVPDRLKEAARRFGSASRVPTLWVHAVDDRSIGIQVGRALHAAFTEAGGTGTFVETPPVGDDQGHNMLGELRAASLWQRPLAAFLNGVRH